MSTASAGGRRWSSAIEQKLAYVSHFEPHVLAVAAPTMLATAIWPGEWVAWVLTPVLLAVIITVAGQPAHEAVWPCGKCADEFPLDAPAEAQRKNRALWTYHSPVAQAVVTMVALVVAIVAPFMLDPTLGRFAITFMYGSWAYFAYARHVHRKLQPWCPWCRRRGEDHDPIVIPEPVPPAAKVDV